ncbi:MAG TPA: hypothetical protein DHV59_05200 [Oxalobacteraceae bacterium]|nr:hypothetical protein [Oxalobacteraceae bacterium]
MRNECIDLFIHRGVLPADANGVLALPPQRLHLLSLPARNSRIGSTRAVGRILLTLLDNAANAPTNAGAAVAVSLTIQRRTATIQIQDQRAGIPPELLKRLGHEQVESTSGGQGIGLLLAFATARQIGANLHLSSNPSSGTLASLTVPLV